MRNWIIIAVLLPFRLLAQDPSASLDTTVIRIGEQATITLRLNANASVAAEPVQWPAIGDTLMPHIEVLRRSTLDTLRPEPGSNTEEIALVQQLVITSFESGFWAIPPFQFQIAGRPFATEPILLEVRSIELDSTAALRDIKDIVEPPFNALFWAQENWIPIAGGMALLALALFLILRKPTVRKPEHQIEQPPIAVHQRITAALLQLKEQKLWQQGMHKQYQSQLTDLLREYIEERYEVPALERTTDELLNELRVSSLAQEQQILLGNMLRAADLVKFAKAIPSAEENEAMMAQALRFVEATAAGSSNTPNPSSRAH